MSYNPLDSEVVRNAKLVRINANSVILELYRNEQVYVSRGAFNRLVATNYDLPCFLVKREFRDATTMWISVPSTL